MALYAEITEIVAPSGAEAGSTVSVQVKIKNKYSLTIGIMVGGALEYGVSPWPSITFPTNQANVGAGAIATFSGSFQMPYYPPGKEVTIHAYSYFYTDAGWVFDDEKTRVITVVAPLSGTITKKELEYNETRATIPASNVPKDKSGLVHIWGKNNTSEAQQMGIAWTLVDPDYITRESHSEWEAWPYTGAGGTHEFIGDRFNLDKAGTWRINVQLYMNPSSPQVVDSYEGDLCIVSEVASYDFAIGQPTARAA
jgi:hypothetical protein